MFRPQISLIFMLHFWEKVRKTWGSNNTLTEYWDLIERKKNNHFNHTEKDTSWIFKDPGL